MRPSRGLGGVSQAILASPEGFRLVLIDSLEISLRTRNCLKRRGINTIEDLSHLTDIELLKIENFGRKCLRDLEEALLEASAKFLPIERPLGSTLTSVVTEPVQDFLPVDAPDKGKTPERTLSEILETWLASLDERRRSVIKARLGLGCEACTLEEVGTKFSITRERVRQIQKKALADLRRVDGLGEKLDIIIYELLDGRRTPLFLAGAPAESPWLANMRWPEQMLKFLIEHPNQRLSVFSLHGRLVVTRIGVGSWEERVRLAKAFLKDSTRHQILEADARRAVEAIAGWDNIDLAEELWGIASENAHFTTGQDQSARRLVAYGSNIDEMVRAVLESSDQPLHYREISTEIERRFGREESRRTHNAAADVGLLLGRGVYGVRRHIELSQSDEDYVCGLCEEFVRDGPEGRQWHARELLADIETVDWSVASNLDHYSLTALLRRSSNLHYVGRFVWVLKPDSRRIRRVRLNLCNAIEALLEEAGVPLSRMAISTRLSVVRGLGETFQIHPKGRLFKVDQRRWGLIDRDFPADSQTLEVWLDALEAALTAKLSALHVSEIHAVLNVDQLYCWPILGAAQRDERFRVAEGGMLCLANWAHTNRMTMHEAMQEVVPLLATGIQLEEISVEVEKRLQYPVSLDTLRSALRAVGAKYDFAQRLWFCNADADADSDDEDEADLGVVT